MTSEGYKTDLNQALRAIAERLDLDDTRYKNAEDKYGAVSEWLASDTSGLTRFQPDIYSQGSFMLGTMVKPLVEDYDLDAVCLLSAGSDLTSKQAFELVGERLRQNTQYKDILKPKNRCWRLNYAGEFHMDVLPAIPDPITGKDAILVPDRELATWTKSNPKGYLEWFKSRMAAQFGFEKSTLASRLQKEVEDIPDYLVKTPLQISVQLMKRHRDAMFQANDDVKPISMIISTLARHAYLEQGNLYDTLRVIVEGMPNAIEDRNGVAWIANPIDLDENFADKWVDNPDLRRAFNDWGEQLQEDLERLGQCASLAECEGLLKQIFGENVATEALKEFSEYSPLTVSRSRFDVPHRQDPSKKWEMTEVNSVKVTVKGFIEHSDSNHEEFQSDSACLDKDLSLYFLAETQHIDRPYEVHWQVVNTGREASEAESNNMGLRGGFYQSDSPGSHRRRESTRYEGMHWVEAFIVKNGYCVARSGEFVVNI